MDVPCENSSNPEIRIRSLELLSQVELGCWVFLIISLLGAINNSILLVVSYHLRWLRLPQYALINMQVFADLMFDITAAGITIYAITYRIMNTPNTIDQLHCVAIFVPTAIFSATSQRLSLAVAIDRLVNVLFPYNWLALGMTYRLIMIALSFAWGLVQETTWLAFADENKCVKMCFDYVSYPADVWWATVVTAGDMITCGLIVIAYMALPPLSGRIFRRLNCQRFFLVALSDMEQRERNMVQRVRLMSVLVVTSFLCTTFIGTVGFDFTPMNANDSNVELLVFIQPFAGALQSLNTVLPLYLFAWKEESVRNELRAIISHVWCFKKSTADFATNSTAENVDSKIFRGVGAPPAAPAATAAASQAAILVPCIAAQTTTTNVMCSVANLKMVNQLGQRAKPVKHRLK